MVIRPLYSHNHEPEKMISPQRRKERKENRLDLENLQIGLPNIHTLIILLPWVITPDIFRYF